MKDFNPLLLLFALGAPIKLEITTGSVNLEIKLKPLRVRTVLSLWGKSFLKEPFSIDNAEVLRMVLEDGVAEFRVNGGRIDNLTNLNPTLSALLLDIVMKANGLVEPTASRMAEELKKIEQDAYESLASSDYTPQSPFFPIAQMAYSAISSGGRFSTNHWIDEPYILMLAAMAVAKGERNYYDSLSKRTESIIETPSISLPTREPLRRKFKSPEEIKQAMKRILEETAGIKIR